MTTRKNPTNQDIFRALGQMDEKLEQIHEQVKATNGRVTRLEKKEASRSVLEDYKEKLEDEKRMDSKHEEPKMNTDIGSNKWLIAFMSSVIIALIAAGALT